MGRAKLDMHLIRKEKSRHATFKKRKEGLVRKIHEFTTLCDVSACMIIHGPKQENCPAQPEIWPENPDEVSRIINIYRGNSVVSGSRNFSLSDFYHCRKKRIQEELEKKRKKRMEMAYPTWVDSMIYLPETQLRDFATILGDKLGFVKCRIESIKGSDHYPPIQNRILVLDGPMKQQQQMMIDCNDNSIRFPAALIQRNTEWDVSAPVNPNEMHAPQFHYQVNIDQDFHHLQMHSTNPNSMMGLLMTENDHYHGAASSCNFLSASHKHDIFYGTPAGAGGGVCPVGLIENAGVYGHPRPLSRYHGPTVQPPVMGPYMPYPSTSDVHVQPNLLSSREYDDHFRYSTRDH